MRKLLVAVAMLGAFAANAADKVKIGFISTLSGPNASIGIDIRDAFNLAVKLNGGKLGGLPAEVLVGDDGLKPEQAKQLAERYLQRDKVDFVTGIVFSNVVLAVAPDAIARQGVLHLAQRRPGAVHGRAVQSVLLCSLVAERGLQRGSGPVRDQQGPEERHLPRPELRRRARRRHRFQALLQGQAAGGDVHQARPARLRGRAVADPRREAARRCTCSCPAAWA